MTWRTYAADEPRFVNPSNRLLIEGQRTNLVPDARTVGGTGWLNSSATMASTTGPDGQAGTGVTLTENTANAQHLTTGPSVNVTSGISYAFSALVRAGTCATCQIVAFSAGFGFQTFANFDVSTGTVGTTIGSNVTRARATLFGQWCLIEMVAPATATAATQYSLNMSDTLNSARGPSYVGTGRALDVSWFQIEVGTFASSPILPPVGAPAASTRGADILSATLSSLGIGANGACTILGTAVIPQNAPTGANQALFQVSDGSDNNRFMLRNVGGGATIVPSQVVGGVTTDGSSAGSMTAGTLFKWGASINGAGRMAVSIDGGAVVAVTGGPTSGLTTLRLGNNFAGTAALFGELGTVTSIARALSDAELVARVNALA